MKVAITGASGMVGKGVLLECLDDVKIKTVFSIGRRKLEMAHPKLQQIVWEDFSDFSGIEKHIEEIDACFACMGVSVAGLGEEEYHKITYDFTLSLAKALEKQKEKITFCYVSGAGTDSTEKGKTMWARVKGKTENALLNFGFKQAFAFRPGVIIPLRGIKSNTKWYQFIYDYFMWFIQLYKFFAPNAVVNTTQMGHAMIEASLNGYKKPIIDPIDTLVLAHRKAE